MRSTRAHFFVRMYWCHLGSLAVQNEESETKRWVKGTILWRHDLEERVHRAREAPSEQEGEIIYGYSDKTIPSYDRRLTSRTACRLGLFSSPPSIHSSTAVFTEHTSPFISLSEREPCRLSLSVSDILDLLIYLEFTDISFCSFCYHRDGHGLRYDVG